RTKSDPLSVGSTIGRENVSALKLLRKSLNLQVLHLGVEFSYSDFGFTYHLYARNEYPVNRMSIDAAPDIDYIYYVPGEDVGTTETLTPESSP
ncbi:MAG: hypothetical protein KC900_08905, partial [Candidatus Omnitrophica bacterium]|nr:hypothetical protein [Candidatus Omnitrophota bacterium]